MYMGDNSTLRMRCVLFLTLCFVIMSTLPTFVSAEVTVVPINELGTNYSLLIPGVVGVLSTIILAWYILPNSLVWLLYKHNYHQ